MLRKGWSCDYPAEPVPLQQVVVNSPAARRGVDARSAGNIQNSSDSPDSSNQTKKSTDQLDGNEVTLSSFPAVFFLDREVFQHVQLSIPRGELKTPTDVLGIIGDIDSIRRVAVDYFAAIHRWMPILARFTFFDSISIETSNNAADVNLRLLAIHLITQTPSPRNSKTPTYLAAKRFYLQAETTGTFTVQVLQAGILIALYELGHGIYPSAYLSIGSCARYGVAIGLNGATVSHATRALTWGEVEERKRVWWAIVIMDRYVCP